MGLSREPIRDSPTAPFDPSPDPRFFFNQSAHGGTLEEVLQGIERREGVLVVSGEAGTGKSTLCGAVLQSLNPTMFATFLPEACDSREDLLKTLLLDFGIVSADSVHHGQLCHASRTQLRYAFHDFLSSLVPLQACAVVVIDEAHKLSTEILHELHLLSVLERRRKVLVFVLVGQSGLKSHLDAPDMQQLAQRVSTWSELPALGRKDVRAYVAHRLAIAGDVTLHFTEAAVDMVYAASGGIPRVINLVCERALARLNHTDTIVDAEDLLGAIADLHLPLAALGREKQTKQESLGDVRIDLPPQRAPREPRPRGSLAAANPIGGQPAGAAEVPGRSSFNILRPHVRGMPGPQVISSDEEWVAAFKASARQPERSRPTIPASSGAPDPAALDNQMASNLADRTGASEHPPAVMFEEEFPPLRPRLMRSRRLVFASLTVTAAVVAFGFWTSRGSPQQPQLETGRVEPVVPEEAPLPIAHDDVASTTGAVEPTGTSNAGPGKSNHGAIALQMGTFQVPENATRMLEELRSAGFRAYIAPVPLPSGKTAVGVFLGPYVDRAEAERDLRRASRNPDYADGHLVRTGRARSLKPPS